MNCYQIPLLASAVLLTGAVVARADDPAPKVDQELESSLLDDLSDDLLEGLEVPATPSPPKVKSPAAPAPDAPAPDAPAPDAPAPDAPAPDPADTTDDEVLAALLGEGEDLGEQANPLARLSREMSRVERSLESGDTSQQTQRTQQAISDQLAKLIEAAKSNSGKSGGQAKPSPSPASQGAKKEPTTAGSQPLATPGTKSTDRVDKPDENIATAPPPIEELFKQAWGHLPERLREQMQNAAVEQFLPKYEKLIEDYFRRLAEEGASP